MSTDVTWTPCEATDLPLGVKTEPADSNPDSDSSYQDGVGPIPPELEADANFFNDHVMPTWDPNEMDSETPPEAVPILGVTGFHFGDHPILQQLQSWSGVSHEQALDAYFRSVEAGRSLFYRT